jgi:OOP family OmpA-OmpF porin
VTVHRSALIAAGAAATVVLAVASAMAHGPRFVAGLEGEAGQVLAGQGLRASFHTGAGWLTRHPTLSGGDALSDQARARAAAAVAALPGVGGVAWAPSASRRRAAAAPDAPVIHCQSEVEAILKARSLRFAEASAELDPASDAVLDEVAGALRPCAGSIVAISGHTDGAGSEAANLALSAARAGTVRDALQRRGIPANGLRARGYGSARPLEGLAPDDAANRRIEFSVIATVPLLPTPVDTPGAG